MVCAADGLGRNGGGRVAAKNCDGLVRGDAAARKIACCRGNRVLQQVSLSLVESDVVRNSADARAGCDGRCNRNRSGILARHNAELTGRRKPHIAIGKNQMIGPQRVNRQRQKSIRSEDALVQSVNCYRLLRSNMNALGLDYVRFIDLHKRQLNSRNGVRLNCEVLREIEAAARNGDRAGGVDSRRNIEPLNRQVPVEEGVRKSSQSGSYNGPPFAPTHG